MDKEKLLNQVAGKDGGDKWYLVIFVAVFVVLILTVIRPSLSEYLRRQKLLEDLVAVNIQYDSAISNLRVLQTLFEERRDDFPLLDEAIPLHLDMYKLVQDVSDVFLTYAEDGVLKFDGYSIGKSQKEPTKIQKNNLFTYNQLIKSQGQQEDLITSLYNLANQRRIKHLTKLTLFKENFSTTSAKIKMYVEFQSYYQSNENEH
jgi:hypothetical protein